MPASLARVTSYAAIVIAIAASAAFTTFGPPKISVRKVSTSDAAAGGAVLVVEASSHMEAETLRLVGRAEGLVNGRRMSQPLRTSTQTAGRFNVAKQWQDGSPWVLVLTAEMGPDGSHAVAEALVPVDARGTIGAIEYPAPGWIDRSDTPKRTTVAVIDAMLTRMLAQR